MQALNRSIIFGNEHKNGYGTFLSLCSAVSSLEEINKIIAYLRESPKFKKYNRFVYAYRVEELPSAFVTEQKDVRPQLYEGIHEDLTIEGSGEKLLYLLQKFNIRNVLTVVVIEQFDVLRRFDHTNYRVIVERAKELLNSLYQKMLTLEQNVEQFTQKDTKPCVKPFLANDVLAFPKVKSKVQIKQRPGHIYSDGRPKFLENTQVDKKSTQVRQLRRQLKLIEERLSKKVMATQRLIQGLSEKDIINLRFVIQYENNPLHSKVIKMLGIVLGMQSAAEIARTVSLERLQGLSLDDLDRAKASKLTGMIISDRRLNFDLLAGQSQILAAMFQIINLLANSFRTRESIDECKARLEVLQAGE